MNNKQLEDLMEYTLMRSSEKMQNMLIRNLTPYYNAIGASVDATDITAKEASELRRKVLLAIVADCTDSIVNFELAALTVGISAYASDEQARSKVSEMAPTIALSVSLAAVEGADLAATVYVEETGKKKATNAAEKFMGKVMGKL